MVLLDAPVDAPSGAVPPLPRGTPPEPPAHRLDGDELSPMGKPCRGNRHSASGVRHPDPFLGAAHRAGDHDLLRRHQSRSDEHTSELQSLMRTSYAVFCFKKKNK